MRCTIEDRGAPLRAFAGTLGDVPAELVEIGATTSDLRRFAMADRDWSAGS